MPTVDRFAVLLRPATMANPHQRTFGGLEMGVHRANFSRSRPWPLDPRNYALCPTVSSSEPDPQARVLKDEIIVHKVAHVSPPSTRTMTGRSPSILFLLL